MKNIKTFACSALIISLSSCSWFESEPNNIKYERENDVLIKEGVALPIDEEVLRVTRDIDAQTTELSNDTKLININPVTLAESDVPTAVETPSIAVKEIKRIEVPANELSSKEDEVIYNSILEASKNAPEKSARNNYIAPSNYKVTEVERSTVKEEPKSLSNSYTPKMTANTSHNGSIPTSASLGDCYGKVKYDAEYKDSYSKVIVEPEKVRTEIIPAKYGYKNQEVVVKEASERYVQVPATYKTVQETITIEPERTEIVNIPAKYKTVQEQVMVKPARKVWKKGRGLIEKKGADGEVLCLREEPAVYETVAKRVMVEPERTEKRTIPAVTKTVTKQVIATPASVKKIIEPAVTKTIQKKIVMEPEQTRKITLPATYKTVAKKVLVEDEKVEWKPIVCNDNINTGLVSQVQAALAARGYKLDVDGMFGKNTAKAVDDYQRSMGYESSGIALETLRSLGISS